MTVDRIISDAQSGAARGALDAALELGLNHGGWCAFNRLADDGLLPPRYLVTPAKGGFGERCARNVRYSDGTLIVALCSDEDMDGRSAYARAFAKKKRKASGFIRLHADREPSAQTIASLRDWLAEYHIRTLHVTGPLEVKEPGIAKAVRALLMAALGKSEQAMAAARAAIGVKLAEQSAPPAPVPPPTTPRMSPREVLRTIVRARYGWGGIDGETVFADPYRDVLLVRFREGCRHTQEIEIESLLLYGHSAIHGLAGAIIDHVDAHRHERRCYCVPRPEAA